MRVAIEAIDVPVSDDELSAVDRALSARVAGAASSWLAGARDLRLRLRQTKNALLCVAAVGFAGGGLVTSTATAASPLDAIVGALDELPSRMDRLEGTRRSAEAASPAPALSEHAAVREELRRLLAAG